MNDSEDGAVPVHALADGQTEVPAQSLAEAYAQLRDTVIELYGNRVWFMVDAIASVHAALLLKDLANPLALILVGGPSTEKTTVLDLFEGLPMNKRIDKFTPASFLTQATNVAPGRLKDVDLLRKICYKVMQVPELAPIFNLPKDTLLENYAILARVLDGHGLSTAGAVHGQRNLVGDYIFGFVGATTPLSVTAWNALSKVGSRLLFLNLPTDSCRASRRNRAAEVMSSGLHYKARMKRARMAVSDFMLAMFKSYRPAVYDLPDELPEDLSSRDEILKHCGFLPRSVEWDRSEDDENTRRKMAFLTEFLTSARQDVRVWIERTEDGAYETNSSGVVLEGVERFASLIYSLARSHALLSGRKGIAQADLPLVAAVAFSSLPDDRRRAIELLLDRGIPVKNSELGVFTKSELARYQGCTDKTAKLLMEKLAFSGIGELRKGSGPTADRFELHEDYRWLIEEGIYTSSLTSFNAQSTSEERRRLAL